MNQARNKIALFSHLPDGWHYGSGVAPSEDMIGSAILYADYISSIGFIETDAFPGVDGEIMITGYCEENCVELTLELDGSFRLAHEYKGKEITYEEGLQGLELPERLETALGWVDKKQCPSSDLFTPGTTMLNAANLLMSLSDHSEEAMEAWGSHALRQFAQRVEANPSALTSQNSIKRLPQTHQSSGYLMSQNSRQMAA